MAETEPVRLVIWDLDETFWDGTLTEGGMRIRDENCNLVRVLASRGIVSSICSKNDFNAVQEILTKAEVWDYFIFPSISWEPKGPRISKLIEAVQLRASTVMFIDDNPLNLQEAIHCVPGIQARSHTYISEIAQSTLFQGKPDPELTRLKQYKLLENRKKDADCAGADVSGFLRSSNIQVTLDWDVENNIDRLIEIINRTNQLNFTKQRFSEDQAVAREEATALLKRYNVQAALIRVKDRYGDHGYCGVVVTNSEHHSLIHFCFSCRILGMGVEQWIYNLLRRPSLTIVGEVLSNPKDQSRTVDWINQSDPATSDADCVKLSVSRIIAHGGCDLSAVAHYFGVHGITTIAEFNLMRNGFSIRTDHSMLLHYAYQGITDDELAIARQIEYSDADFKSKVLEGTTDRDCILLSFATDAHHALYQHRTTGLQLPCVLGFGAVSDDQRKHEIPSAEREKPRFVKLQYLKDEFDFVGLIGEGKFKENITAVFEAIDSATKVFVLRPCDYHLNKKTMERYPSASFVRINKWTEDVAIGFPNVHLLDLPQFVRDPSEIENILHYDRKVYYRIYEEILGLVRVSEASEVKVPA